MMHINTGFLKAFPVAIALIAAIAPKAAQSQCSTTTAVTCQCKVSGQTNCELLPDIQISWHALANYAGGPNQYAQNASSNAGRLRVSGSTPNQGFGPLEVRGVNAQNQRTFICGTDTISVNNLPNDNNGFTCPNGLEARQRLYQRVYSKNGNAMTYTEELRGTMTYHPTHNHYHVDDWTTMTLRIQQAGVNDPRDWPIVATGAKLGFCLMDLSTCSGSPGHCRTSQVYNQGTSMSNASFPNYGLGIGYTCSENFQGISSGKTDIYDEGLDGMWINLLPGNPGLPVLCNGSYWIVAEVDPRNAWREENEDNNYTAIPITISTQKASGSGGTGSLMADKRALLAPGQSITLTATPGSSYLWSNGATTRSITVSAAGNYSCSVTAPCGAIATPSITVSQLAPPAAPPIGTGTTVLAGSPATISATGSNVRWYDAASGGNLIGTGNSLNIPALNATTNYWAAASNVSLGTTINAGKADNSGTGGYFNGKHWLYFDAFEPFNLVSFKVYANSTGKRQFVLRDQLGNLIHEKFVELLPGMTEVVVNWPVPAGVQHAITAFDDNSDVFQDLYRNNAGVSYPYSIGTLGSITGSSGGSGVYYFLYDWRVTTNDVIAETARTQVTATAHPGVGADVKVLLDGPYNSLTGLMDDGLRAAGLIPTLEPFTALGFTHVNGGGGETVQSSFLQTTGASAPVDWVLLELRSASTPSQVVATRSALVTRNGNVVSGSGGTVRFNLLDGNYHLAVRHRNHFGCMTSTPVSLNAGVAVVDLRNSATLVYGTEARKPLGSVMGLWSGNVQRDNTLKYVGEVNDRDPILFAIGGSIPTNTASGYLPSDVNLDGVVKYVGDNNDRDPILFNLGGSIPTNTRLEQLP
jgi:hypothetical protein